MTTTTRRGTAGTTRLHRPAQTHPKCALNWDNRGTSEEKPRRRLAPSRGVADLLGVDVAKRTASVPAGTACVRCGRSKADEPEQFRLIFRSGAAQPRMASLCRPCEHDWEAEYRERRRNDPQTCTIDGCEENVRAVNMCSRHYNLSLLTGECTFDDCDRPARADDLCQGHKRQQKAGKALRPLQQKTNPSLRDEQGRKLCTVCKAWLTTDKFYRNSRYSDGLTIRCVNCHRNRTLERQYGITLAEYRELLEAQGGGCAICGKTEETNGRLLAVDHDHACCAGNTTCGKCTRGLLCCHCNLHLGAVGDRIEHLEAMITYLRAGTGVR